MQDKLKEKLEQIKKEELNQKIAEELRQLSEQREAARMHAMDELMKKSYITNSQGQKTTLWNMLDEEVHKAINSGELMSFNDFRAALMSLIHLYGLLVDALNQTEVEWLQKLEFLVSENLAFPAIDAIKKRFRNDPEIVLPALQHNVSYSDDNKLNIAPLIRSDYPNRLSQALDDVFKESVVFWLQGLGYEKNASNPGTFLNTRTGAVLDKDTFNALKDDSEHGLDNFLKGHTQVQCSSGMNP